MTTHDQYPSQEAEAALHQRFEGQVIDEYVKQGHNTVHIPMLRAEISKDQSIVVAPDVEAPRLGDFMGAPVIAQLDLGFHTENTRPEKVVVARVDPDNQNRRLRSYLSYAEGQEALDPNKPFFMVVDGDATISGFTIVRPSTRFGLFGRAKNNMSWFDAFGKPFGDDHKNEVIHNRSVSKQQLILSYDESGGLRITGQTENSDTVVTTVATDEHQKILKKNEAAKQAAAEAAKRGKTGSRISRVLSGRRSK